MDLYERVCVVAKEKGYSINKLEKECGFARSYISKFRTITPSAENLQKVANALGVSVDYIMKGEDAEKYYLNDETAEIAQEIYENKEMRILFDAARDAEPDDLKAVYDMLLHLKRKEKGE